MVRQPEPAAAGDPWPDAAYGEVVGPSGSRCYTTDSAAAIFERSGRQVRNWLRDHKTYPDLVVDGTSKHPYFLLADGVEALARRLGKWPLPAADVPADLDEEAWQDLFRAQGRDLDRARAARRAAEVELGDSNAEIQRLSRRLHNAEYQVGQLTIALEAAAKAAARRYHDT